MNERIAKNVLTLLRRVTIKGEEVPLFAEAQIELERIIKAGMKKLPPEGEQKRPLRKGPKKGKKKA